MNRRSFFATACAAIGAVFVGRRAEASAVSHQFSNHYVGWNYLAVSRRRTEVIVGGAFPGVVLEFDRRVADPDKATIERLQARIASAYVGVRRTGQPIVIGPGVRLCQYRGCGGQSA